MENISLTVDMVVFFLIRIGMPVLLLITLGTIIERWQQSRERRLSHQPAPNE